MTADFIVGDPPPVIFLGIYFKKICFFVTNKTHVAKFPFPALLVRPGNWKEQYVTSYSEEGFSLSFWYLFRKILLRYVH